MGNLINKVLQETVENNFSKIDCKTTFEYLKTNKIKLYKYCSIDDNTINNIKNSAFYLSDFSKFNDPFDANIGISVNQVYQCLIPHINLGLNGSLKTIGRDEVEFLFSECSKEDEDEILEILTGNTAFEEFINDNNIDGINDEEVLKFFISNVDLLSEMINVSLPKNAESSEQSLINAAIKETIKGLENTSSIENAKKAFTIIDEPDIDFLQKSKKLANLFGQEISEDDINNVYNQIDEMIKGLYIRLSKVIGVSCFSTTSDNILMWSHYADKHRGVCIEYDFSLLEKLENINAFLLPVIYSIERPLLPVDKLDLKNGQDTQESVKRIMPDLIRAILTKSEFWGYENEWRFIALGEPKQPVKLPIISKIFTGANITNDDYNKVVSAIGDRHIPITKYSLKRDKYELY